MDEQAPEVQVRVQVNEQIDLNPGTLVRLSDTRGLSSVSLLKEPSYDASPGGFFTEGETALVISTIDRDKHGMTLRWVYLIVNDGTQGWTDRIEYLENVYRNDA